MVQKRLCQCWVVTRYPMKGHKGWGPEPTLGIDVCLLQVVSLLRDMGVGTCIHWPECYKNQFSWPWLVWLSGLSTSLWTKGSLVQLSVRAHVWIVGQVSSRGHTRGNHTLMFFSPSFSLPSPLSRNKNLLKNRLIKLMQKIWFLMIIVYQQLTIKSQLKQGVRNQRQYKTLILITHLVWI